MRAEILSTKSCMKKGLVSLTTVFLMLASPVYATQTEKYKNCSALNAKYPGGIAKSASAVNKNKKGEVVKSKKPFDVNEKLYNAHKSLDRDKDNIVCEK